jgi:hypothetical protein
METVFIRTANGFLVFWIISAEIRTRSATHAFKDSLPLATVIAEDLHSTGYEVRLVENVFVDENGRKHRLGEDADVSVIIGADAKSIVPEDIDE